MYFQKNPTLTNCIFYQNCWLILKFHAHRGYHSTQKATTWDRILGILCPLRLLPSADLMVTSPPTTCPTLGLVQSLVSCPDITSPSLEPDNQSRESDPCCLKARRDPRNHSFKFTHSIRYFLSTYPVSGIMSFPFCCL